MAKEQKINVVILGPLVFPRACAPTSRVMAYAKGMLENGADVTIICVRPVGNTAITPTGTAQGVEYVYSAGVTQYHKNKLVQIFYELKGLFFAIAMVISRHHRKKIDALLLYATYAHQELIFAIIARLFGIKIMRDLCEYPFYYDRSKNYKLKIRGYLYERIVFPRFDALITISIALLDYSKPFLNRKARYLMIPIMVDTRRFEIDIESPEKYIAYCGDPGGYKDGVDILIDAFSKIAGKYPDIKLYIIGDTANRGDPDFLKRLQKNVDEKCGYGRIVLTGHVDYDTVPRYLCGAYALVLARPQSVQAKYGFPTKLGEYLATGNPVLVTDVGEIGNYIKDGLNGFIAKPGDVEAFALKLDYILANPDIAKQAGRKGKALASDAFDYNKHGRRLVEFIKQF
jgi:glycosyltransferase involved in cell wall biosynthesis